ncbi:hypothetical protein ACN38_g271 [Penicillium nordicum]|uniref:Uncharacterized protein n=1 Tax=Penicillium nordicum TaxID=229535 RepID=A0A0M8PAP5_9EURO|nr:hypothetical protein ACN38_g271 [Penicillium nordicum]
MLTHLCFHLKEVIAILLPICSDDGHHAVRSMGSCSPPMLIMMVDLKWWCPPSTRSSLLLSVRYSPRRLLPRGAGWRCNQYETNKSIEIRD